MIEEYYLSYYDARDRYHYSVYYTSEKEAEQVKQNLEQQGYKRVQINRFRY